MPTYAGSHGPKPKSWEEFENIVCSAAKNRWRSPDFTLHGRQGQSQDGVDIYGHDQDGELVGLQCKNTLAGVTEATIRSEVEKAEKFDAALAKLYIATTAETDKNIQAVARALSQERKAQGAFTVHILFWNDVWHDLTLDDSRLYQHFPQLRPQAAASAGPTHDQKLFGRFKTDLAFDPSIRFLREHDFRGAFSYAAIKPLFTFVDNWNQPECEFIDADLNARLQAFYAEACAMSDQITIKTVPVGDQKFGSVYSDNQRAAGPRPAHVLREAREINQAAAAFALVYEDFLRHCRARLEG